MKVGFLRLGGAALMVALAGCSSDEDPPKKPSGVTGIAGSSTSGSYSAPAGTGSVAGARSIAGTPSVIAGTYGGIAGTGAKAGSGGAAGAIAIAGSSGAAGTTSAGAGGVTAPPSGEGHIREAAPTEASIRGKGEFSVKSYTEAMGLIGGDAYGAAAAARDGSELYYPEGATPPFSAMAIVPGFTAQRSDVAPWGPFLASHGIIALVIDTNTTGDQPDVRAAALLDAIESLKKENMRSGSPVEGQIDTTRLGVMGWSMGGGGTWIAANSHPELKVAVSLCGWITAAPGAKTTTPSLQLAARDDGLAKGMSQPVFNAIPMTTPKMLIEFIAPAGSVLSGHYIANDPANMDKQIGAYGLSWIKEFLDGDTRYHPFLLTMPTTTSAFMTNQK